MMRHIELSLEDTVDCAGRSHVRLIRLELTLSTKPSKEPSSPVMLLFLNDAMVNHLQPSTANARVVK